MPPSCGNHHPAHVSRSAPRPDERGRGRHVRQAPRARTAVEHPDQLAALLLDEQGQPGPAHWTTTQDGIHTNDGHYSYRNPANHFALPTHRLARVRAALTP
ncbi:hypothetical protein GCM10009760_61590 [Kitasatospora kazusensis]|uniref:Uncharacterized protein n=1 Tax=Kitasatospora kazusensis TaxID=407974 RepID=A0ABN3ABD5_9ACTN